MTPYREPARVPVRTFRRTWIQRLVRRTLFAWWIAFLCWFGRDGAEWDSGRLARRERHRYAKGLHPYRCSCGRPRHSCPFPPVYRDFL